MVGPRQHARPQPRRLILSVDSQEALDRQLVKTKDATVSIPELADEASPLPWGWTIAVQDRFRDLRCSVRQLIVDAAVRLETEVPPWLRDSPQIATQVRAIRTLLEDPKFTVVLHEHVRWPTAGAGAAEAEEDDDRGGDDSAAACSFGAGAGRLQEVFGDPGIRPAALPSLDLDGIAAFILSGSCRSVALLTGAGISTASGIPDYRGSGGLWSTLAPEVLTATPEQRARIARDPEWAASIELFKENPLPLLEVKRGFIRGLAQRLWRPTAAHFFVRLLHEHGLLTRVLTQNIDGLHQDAGVPEEKVTQIHGSIRTAKCTNCDHELPLSEFAEALRVHVRDIGAAADRDPAAPDESSPIPCPACEGRGAVRPTVVLFGEPVDPAFRPVFRDELPKADLLIVIGTSVSVAPAGKAPAQVGPSCVRLVVNDRRVGENAGLCFDPPAAARDVMAQGDIDRVFVELAAKLGWLPELAAYKGQMAARSAALL
uniref:Deacetylase sirtuin-type domain-containing protein n=2 Tax=Alexandrium monilatum TaxID=311494 RepID=A0A7S4SB83_9DINO